LSLTSGLIQDKIEELKILVLAVGLVSEELINFGFVKTLSLMQN